MRRVRLRVVCAWLVSLLLGTALIVATPPVARAATGLLGAGAWNAQLRTPSGECLHPVAPFVAGGGVQVSGCFWTYGGYGFDEWDIVAVGSAYELRNRYSDMCLDVTASSQSAGAAVIMWPCTRAPNQLWSVTARSGGALVASHSGKCLDGGTSLPVSTTARQQSCGGPRQAFSVVNEAAPDPFSSYPRTAMESVSSPGNCVKAYPYSSMAFASSCTQAPRTWRLVNTIGGWLIMNRSSARELCVDAAPSTNYYGAYVKQAACDARRSQIWQVSGTTSRAQIKSVADDRCLTFGTGYPNGGIALQPCSYSTAQYWNLSSAPISHAAANLGYLGAYFGYGVRGPNPYTIVNGQGGSFTSYSQCRGSSGWTGTMNLYGAWNPSLRAYLVDFVTYSFNGRQGSTAVLMNRVLDLNTRQPFGGGVYPSWTTAMSGGWSGAMNWPVVNDGLSHDAPVFAWSLAGPQNVRAVISGKAWMTNQVAMQFWNGGSLSDSCWVIFDLDRLIPEQGFYLGDPGFPG